MASYTTKFSVGDTAYYIKHANVISVVVSDIYIHDFVGLGINSTGSSSNINPPLISYKVSHSVNSSGVGVSKNGPSTFNESDLYYIAEVTATMNQILAQKALNLQALN